MLGDRKRSEGFHFPRAWFIIIIIIITIIIIMIIAVTVAIYCSFYITHELGGIGEPG